MSRSYKKTPVVKDRSPYHKNQANRRVRRTKGVVFKGALYKRLFEQYDICDYALYAYKSIRLMTFDERKDYILK